MYFDDAIYQEYLAELQALKQFRQTHAGYYRDTPLDKLEDPDAERLLEALALFSSRTRLHAEKAVASTHERIFRQLFSYLLTPLPAMALIQISSNGRPGPVVIPQGSEVYIDVHSGSEKGRRRATFSTLKEVHLLPLSIVGCSSERLKDDSTQVKLRFSSEPLSIGGVNELTLHISHLSDYAASATVFSMLARCLRSLRAHFDGEGGEGGVCELIPSPSPPGNFFTHPVEQIRSHLHLPSQELYFRIALPHRKKKWKSLSLTFDLNSRWPRGLSLTEDSFALFVVPVANLKRSHADVIHFDARREKYPILYPDPSDSFELYKVTQVSNLLPEGSVPLKPGILGPESFSYEVDSTGGNSLRLQIPDAQMNTKRVGVEAIWTQPWFSDQLIEEISISFAKEHASNLNLSVLGSIVAHEKSFAEERPDLLLKLLALKNQSHLGKDDLLVLWLFLKNLDRGVFKSIPSLIIDVISDQRVDQVGVALGIEYIFLLKEVDEQNFVSVILFFRYIHIFLTGWLSNFQVQTKVEISGREVPVVFKGEGNYELDAMARDIAYS